MREPLASLCRAIYQAKDSNVPLSAWEGTRARNRFLKQVIETGLAIRKASSFEDAVRIQADGNKTLLQGLKKMGMPVRWQTEWTPAELKAKPTLILSTHQGGGLETYVSRAFIDLPYHIVLKEELLQFPVFKTILIKSESITVCRKKLSNSALRVATIRELGQTAAQRLTQGRSVLIYFEGTRSRDGQIAATPMRRQWAREFIGAIREAIPADLDYQTAVLAVDTLSALPEPFEKAWLSKSCLKKGVGFNLVKAPNNLSLQENPADPEDPTTLYGLARQALRPLLEVRAAHATRRPEAFSLAVNAKERAAID